MPSAPSLRSRLKAETQDIILSAFIDCLGKADIDKITYADLAAAAGVSERTVFRHFPTRDDLIRGLHRALVTHGGGAQRIMPDNEADLTDKLRGFYTRFDEIAPAMRAAALTPQGHEIRLVTKTERKKAYCDVVADIAPDMAPRDRQMVAAMLSLLRGNFAWLSGHDLFDLDGEEIAKACAFAIDAIVEKARAQGGEPIPEAPRDADLQD